MVSRGIPAKPGVAFAIARSIAKNGTKPQPFLRETRVELESLVPSIRTAIEMDLKKFTDERIKNKVKEQIKNGDLVLDWYCTEYKPSHNGKYCGFCELCGDIKAKTNN